MKLLGRLKHRQNTLPQLYQEAVKYGIEAGLFARDDKHVLVFRERIRTVLELIEQDQNGALGITPGQLRQILGELASQQSQSVVTQLHEASVAPVPSPPTSAWKFDWRRAGSVALLSGMAGAILFLMSSLSIPIIAGLTLAAGLLLILGPWHFVERVRSTSVGFASDASRVRVCLARRTLRRRTDKFAERMARAEQRHATHRWWVDTHLDSLVALCELSRSRSQMAQMSRDGLQRIAKPQLLLNANGASPTRTDVLIKDKGGLGNVGFQAE